MARIAATRAFVTGADGFVGRHLCAELRARGIDTVAAAGTAPRLSTDLTLELTDAASVARAVAEARPDVVFHLAAQAFVPLGTADPLGTYAVNVMGTAHVVEAIRALERQPLPRLLFASSGEVYGRHERAEMPLGEDALPRPATVYAASKLAGEGIVLASSATFGLPGIVTRAFNHIGPGQDERFAVAAFGQRLARIAAGGDPRLPVGNLATERDFLDVRDVVRAYADLAERGTPGEIYNVCSGVPTPMSEVLRRLVTIARVGVEIREDAALMRPSDLTVFYGDNRKLVAATGWTPTFPLGRSLRDVYEAALAHAAAK